MRRKPKPTRWFAFPEQLTRCHLRTITPGELKLVLTFYEIATKNLRSWSISYARTALMWRTGLCADEIKNAFKKLQERGLISDYWQCPQGKEIIDNVTLPKPPRRPNIQHSRFKQYNDKQLLKLPK